MGESADRTRTDAKKWSRPMGPGAGGTTWRATSSLFTRLPIGPDGRRSAAGIRRASRSVPTAPASGRRATAMDELPFL